MLGFVLLCFRKGVQSRVPEPVYLRFLSCEDPAVNNTRSAGSICNQLSSQSAVAPKLSFCENDYVRPMGFISAYSNLQSNPDLALFGPDWMVRLVWICHPLGRSDVPQSGIRQSRRRRA